MILSKPAPRPNHYAHKKHNKIPTPSIFLEAKQCSRRGTLRTLEHTQRVLCFLFGFCAHAHSTQHNSSRTSMACVVGTMTVVIMRGNT